MAISQGICLSFKQELFEGRHDFRTTGSTYKMALYTSSATISPASTVYTATGEASGTAYSAGGASLTNVDPALSGDYALLDFADIAWAASTITARGAMIYNSSVGNRAIAVIDFGSDKSSSASTFTVTFPAAAAATAIIRLS